MKECLNNNSGFTLIEVLLVLVITSIVSVSIYGTFTTGIQLYQKIAIEGQLRDDADYIATLILNEIYENTPNYIEDYKDNGSGAKGIRIVRYKPKNVEGYLVEQETETADAIAVDKLIYFEGDKLFIKDLNKNKTEISSESSTIINNSGIETSQISMQCSKENEKRKCVNGIISLTLILEDSKERYSSLLKTEPLRLESTFGF